MNQNVDERLLTYIANEVANHKFAKLIESIKNLDYFTNKCTYCKMPTSQKKCTKCNKCWCDREYYCEKPKDNKGVFNENCKCENDQVCSGCYQTCHIDNCKETDCASYGGNLPCIEICLICKLPTCQSHGGICDGKHDIRDMRHQFTMYE